MKPELLDLLPDYVLGTLPEAQCRQVEALAASSPAVREEIDRLTEALALAGEDLPPVEPAPGTRARLLQSAAAADRFSGFWAPLGRLLDLPLEAVRSVLHRIDDPSTWEQGLPGFELQHFEAGPRLANADAGFVRVQAGASFPRHRHVGGPEVTFVLEGTMRDGDKIHGPGAVVEHADGTVHEYGAAGERALVILTVHHGIMPVVGDN